MKKDMKFVIEYDRHGNLKVPVRTRIRWFIESVIGKIIISFGWKPKYITKNVSNNSCERNDDREQMKVELQVHDPHPNIVGGSQYFKK